MPARLWSPARVLYAGRPDNVTRRFEAGDTAEHTDAVFAAAERTVSFRLDIGRVMGTRWTQGTIAAPDATAASPGGRPPGPPRVRDTIASITGMPQHRIRGRPRCRGGFGLKDHLYEDEVMVCLAALHLGRPVKWIDARRPSWPRTRRG